MTDQTPPPAVVVEPDTGADLRDLSKPVLQDVASGLDLPASGTKDQIATRVEDATAVAGPAPAAAAVTTEAAPSGPVAVQPIITDGRNRRSDDDANVHGFVDVVAGEHKGRFGAIVQVLEHDAKTGYPARVLLRTRDEFNELLALAYSDVRNSLSHGGR